MPLPGYGLGPPSPRLNQLSVIRSLLLCAGRRAGKEELKILPSRSHDAVEHQQVSFMVVVYHGLLQRLVLPGSMHMWRANSVGKEVSPVGMSQEFVGRTPVRLKRSSPLQTSGLIRQRCQAAKCLRSGAHALEDLCAEKVLMQEGLHVLMMPQPDSSANNGSYSLHRVWPHCLM